MRSDAPRSIHRLWLAPALLLALLPGACRGGGTPSSTPPELALSVLPESFVPGGSADFSLRSEPLGRNEWAVDILASQTSGLRAAYFELSYDAAQWHAVEARASGLLQSSATAGLGEVLELAVLDRPGKVWHGQVLARWPEQAGLSRDGAVLRLRLARGPARRQADGAASSGWRQASSEVLAADGPVLRKASFTPFRATDQVRDLTLRADPAGGWRLIWRYRNTGDYDLNGQANIADLTALGRFYRANSSDSNWLSDAVFADGDRNGEVNAADITPLGQNFLAGLDGYEVWGRAALTPGTTQLGNATLDKILRVEGQALLTYHLDSLDYKYYRIWPYDSSTYQGPWSNFASLGQGPRRIPVKLADQR